MMTPGTGTTHRSLTDILTDVIAHDTYADGHGPNCICMDGFAREMREQIRQAMMAAGTNPEKRMMAHLRVGRVLRDVLRVWQ